MAIPRDTRLQDHDTPIADADSDDVAGFGSGWVAFAGVYLFLAGGMNLIWGIVALANAQFFAAGDLVWANLRTWGWVSVAWGVIQLLAGAFVLTRHRLGQMLAAVVAIIGFMVNFLSIGAYPVWSLLSLAANAAVLWAVTAHADDFS